MPNYKVRVSYVYPVQAVDAKDALSTVPIATRQRYGNAQGLAEIISEGDAVVLRARLVNGVALAEVASQAIEKRKGETNDG